MTDRISLRWSAIFFIVLLLPALSWAELYKWRDSNGMLHVTDDLHMVPREFRPTVEKVPATPVTGPGAGSQSIDNDYAPDYTESIGVEINGGKSLEWWKSEFTRLRKKIDWLERNNKNMEQYVAVFEGGRRFGQIFGAEEVAKYEEYKRDLPEDRALLVKVRKELDKLTLEAEGFGVPQDVIDKGRAE